MVHTVIHVTRRTPCRLLNNIAWTFCVAEQQELKERHVADRQQWEDRSQADLEVRMFLNGFRWTEADVQMLIDVVESDNW